MNAPTRYERWTGVLPSGRMPRRSSKSTGANPIAAPIRAEVSADPAPILPAGTGETNTVAFGRPGGVKEGTARATALSPKRWKAIAQIAATMPPAHLSNLSRALPTPHELPLRQAREAFERAYFEQLLARGNDSLARVAEKSGLDRTHLYRKLKALGIAVGKKDESA